MRNVLLISPSSNTYYTLTAPLGLSYIAAQLESDFNVYGLDLSVYRQFYQFNVEDLYVLVERILVQFSIDYVGISILEETLIEANTIAQICKRHNICCIAGGVYPTLYPDDLTDDYQYCTRGDGEYTMYELLTALENQINVDNIQGLSVYSTAEKKWIHQGPAAAITCKEDFLPSRDVFSRLNGEFSYTAARIITSRGCVYNCSFCTNQIYQSTYLRRSINSIIREVKILIEEHIQEIIFSDDQFLGTSEIEYRQAYNILNALKPLLKNNNVRINFQIRADHWLKCIKLLPEMLQLICDLSTNYIDHNMQIHRYINGRVMHRIGIDVGVESFLDRKLTYFRKGYAATCNVKCIRSLISLPIDLGLYMILFTPDITIEEIIKEIHTYYIEYLSKGYRSKLLLSNLFKELIPYKGTRFYEDLQKCGGLSSQRGYHFKDLRVAAFYLIISVELEALTCKEEISFDDLFNAIMNFAEYCKNLRMNKPLASELSKIVCNNQNNPETVYSLMFCR